MTPWPSRFTATGAGGEAGQRAEAPIACLRGVDCVLGERQRLEPFDSVDHFNLEAVWIGQPHTLAGAGLVHGLDARGAARFGELR
jgi:hypothetical protein